MSRILIVTGGSRGIGAATARLAAQRGYDVCILYRKSHVSDEASYSTGAFVDVSGGL